MIPIVISSLVASIQINVGKTCIFFSNFQCRKTSNEDIAVRVEGPVAFEIGNDYKVPPLAKRDGQLGFHSYSCSGSVDVADTEVDETIVSVSTMFNQDGI